ncbi:pentapeptide repeat-containing protein [Streptomyces sp. NPDC057257]|uniref:pentapeptide repeat-containing protein n=1 Tax=Streptomyces sp. NPDC057257 TaxID=3346071 RepID=UPI00363CC914
MAISAYRHRMWQYAVWGLIGAGLYRSLIIRAAVLRDRDPFLVRDRRWSYPEGPGAGALRVSLCVHGALGAAVGFGAALAGAANPLVALLLGAVTSIMLKQVARLALRLLIPDALDGGTEIRVTDRRYRTAPPGHPPGATDGRYPWATELARRIRAQEVARPVNLQDAHLNGVDLTGVDLPRVYAVLGTLPGVCFREANLSQGIFYVANLIGADLTRARLDGADLGSASLVAALLTGADLTGARLTGAKLHEADLAGARLSGAALDEAKLVRANLTDADLTSADLQRADLTGADLSGADLTDANLAGARWTSETVWPAGQVDRMRDRSERLFDEVYRLHGGAPGPFKPGRAKQLPFVQRLLIAVSDAAPAFRPLRAGVVGNGRGPETVGRPRLVGSTAVRRALASSEAALSGVDLSGTILGSIDLTGVNLSGSDLSRVDFMKATLKGANLARADLTRTRLMGADLSGANLKGANLAGSSTVGTVVTGARLTGANLHHAYLPRQNLSGARLTRTNLTRAFLSSAKLVRADLTDADLTHVALSKADLRGAKLLRAQMTDADLSEAGLVEADLTEATLTCASLFGADLSQAHLTGARLTLAYLDDANLRRADLSHADLAGARMIGACLKYAKLTGARFRGANLTGADLTGAHMYGADFAEVVWSSTTKWPGPIANRIRAQSETASDGTFRVRVTKPAQRLPRRTGTSQG